MDERPANDEHAWPASLAHPAREDQQATLLARMEALHESVAALEKQIGRAGREQFKANTMAETQATQLAAALEALRAADERREAELAALRERNQAAQIEARLEVVRAILPAIDGLDEALRSGRQALAQHRDLPSATGQPEQPRTAVLARLFGRFARSRRWFTLRRLWALLAPAPPASHGEEETAALHAALEAWLVGLEFVRRRLLDALAAQGVVPIKAEGAPFDPRYHLAVEIAPPTAMLPPGSVVHEIRRGYMAGGRVLRHAEVAVTRAE